MKTTLLVSYVLFGIALQIAAKALLEFLDKILPSDTLSYGLALLILLAILIAIGVSASTTYPRMPIQNKRRETPALLSFALGLLIFNMVWFQAERNSSQVKLIKIQAEQIKLQEVQIQEMNMMISSTQSACSL
jgi:hypothetical protein